MDAMSLTLAQAADQIEYGAQCQRCWETVRIDLRALAGRHPGMLVRDIRARLRCSRCGSRDPIICTLWLSQVHTALRVSEWKSPRQLTE